MLSPPCSSTGAASGSPARASGSFSRSTHAPPISPWWSRRTRCGTALPLICSREEPRFGTSRSSLGMPISPQPRSTPNSQTTTCATSTTERTRARTDRARAVRSRALCLLLLGLSLIACTRPGGTLLGPSPMPGAAEPPAGSPPAASTAAPKPAGPPPADPFALARRLLRVDPSHTVNTQAPDYRVGDRASFWLEEPSAPSSYQVNAVLRYRGEHVWVYLQERAQVADAALTHVGEVFDTEIYPQVTAELGPPLFPGIDADPRVTILLADLRGLGGYFTQIDNEPAAIERTSNQRKMIYLDLASATPGTIAFDGNVAHEFQHLLHYARNPAAQAWINEGMSELVRWQVTKSVLNIPAYEDEPDTQLND